MVNLDWCKNKKKGIELVEPNDNLFNEYIATAEETLDILKSIKQRSKMWVATTKYYCEYFSVYALLMKLGIKCEIHDCTIALANLLEKEGLLPKGYSVILSEDKQLRIDNQYYLKNRDVPLDYDKVLQFVLKMKDVGLKLTASEIEIIRKKISI